MSEWMITEILQAIQKKVRVQLIKQILKVAQVIFVNLLGNCGQKINLSKNPNKVL